MKILEMKLVETFNHATDTTQFEMSVTCSAEQVQLVGVGDSSLDALKSILNQLEPLATGKPSHELRVWNTSIAHIVDDRIVGRISNQTSLSYICNVLESYYA